MHNSLEQFVFHADGGRLSIQESLSDIDYVQSRIEDVVEMKCLFGKSFYIQKYKSANSIIVIQFAIAVSPSKRTNRAHDINSLIWAPFTLIQKLA